MTSYEYDLRETLRKLLNLIENDGLNSSLAGPILAKARKLAGQEVQPHDL